MKTNFFFLNYRLNLICFILCITRTFKIIMLSTLASIMNSAYTYICMRTRHIQIKRESKKNAHSTPSINSCVQNENQLDSLNKNSKARENFSLFFIIFSFCYYCVIVVVSIFFHLSIVRSFILLSLSLSLFLYSVFLCLPTTKLLKPP